MASFIQRASLAVLPDLGLQSMGNIGNGKSSMAVPRQRRKFEVLPSADVTSSPTPQGNCPENPGSYGDHPTAPLPPPGSEPRQQLCPTVEHSLLPRIIKKAEQLPWAASETSLQYCPATEHSGQLQSAAEPAHSPA